MIRISLVSYSNTLPFKSALMGSEFIAKNAVINERNPAECAMDLINAEADIALLPIGALPLLKDYKIISDYCLSSYKKVESVLLLSNVPREEITEVILDYQSRTSVKLIKVLAEFYWKTNYSYIDSGKEFGNLIDGTTAAVIIGDRALNLRNSFLYKYDLAEEWYNFTGLPAVFAVWVTRKEINPDFLKEFNNILGEGVKNRSVVGEQNSHLYSGFDLKSYLTNCIDYKLTDEKFVSIDKFREYVKLLRH